MVGEDVSLRMRVENARGAAREVDVVGNALDRAGNNADRAGRRAAAGARGFDVMGKAGRAALLGTGAAAYGVFRVGKSAIENYSDLSETVNKSNVIFGRNAAAVNNWSKTAATSFGVSRQEALASAAQFGDMFSQLGFGQKAAVGMSQSVVQMAADLGSFNNLGTDDVLERIGAGFRGEYDSLQLLIPNINAARVEQEALNATGKTAAKDLTAQEKAQATLNIVRRDGSRANGDFARTSKGLANQQKIAAAQYEDASAKLGRSLIPLQLEATQWVNKEGIPALSRFAGWFGKEGAPQIKSFVNTMKPLASEVGPAVATSLGAVRDALSTAAPYAQQLVGAFNNMPGWAQKGLAVGAVGGLAASKLGLLGRGGPAGAAAGLVGGGGGPVPVIVMNPGFGGPLGPGGKPGVGGPVVVPGADGDDGKRGKRPRTRPRVGAAGSFLMAAGLPYAVDGAADLAGGLFGWKATPKKQQIELQNADIKIANSAGYKGDNATVDYQRELRSAAFGLAGVSTGKGPFGVLGNDDGLAEKLKGMDISSLAKIDSTLRTEFGQGFKYLSRTAGVLPKGFYDDFTNRVNGGAVGAPSSGRNGALDDLMAPTLDVKLGGGKGGGISPAMKSYQRWIEDIPANVKTDVIALGLNATEGDVKRLTNKYNGLDRRQVKTILQALGIPATEAALNRVARDRQSTVTVTTVRRTVLAGAAIAAGVGLGGALAGYVAGAGEDGALHDGRSYAAGGLRRFADGGWGQDGRYYSREPQIVAGGADIRWGEKATGWEAYISGKSSQRARNLKIWRDAGQRLGARADDFASTRRIPAPRSGAGGRGGVARRAGGGRHAAGGLTVVSPIYIGRKMVGEQVRQFQLDELARS